MFIGLLAITSGGLQAAVEPSAMIGWQHDGAGVALTPTLESGFQHEGDVAGLAFKDG
jgi:hypothetical protein